MKKSLAVLLFVAALSSAAYVFMSRDAPRIANSIASPSNSVLYLAIQEALRAHESGIGERLSLLVPGEKVDLTSWNFRATTRNGDLSKPVFGTIRNLCDAFADANCWTLISLEIDGQPAFSGQTSQSAPVLDQVVSSPARNALSQERDEPAATQSTSLQPAAASDAPVLSETATPAEKWRTRSENVNGRMGPGTEYDIAFKVPRGMALTLVETRSGWGRFEYPTSDGSGAQIWIWMQLVEKN
jgi:uncharacterized protein YgiM (DUF1202 family)